MKRFTPLSLLCLLATAASLPLDIDTAVKLGQSVVGGSTGSLYFVPEGNAVVGAAAQPSPVMVLRPQPSPQFFGSYGGFGGYNNFLPQRPIFVQVPAPAPAVVPVPAPIALRPAPAPVSVAVVAPVSAPAVVPAPYPAVVPPQAPAVVPPPAPAVVPAPAPAQVPRPAPVPAAVKAPTPVSVKPVEAAYATGPAYPGIPAEYTYNYVVKGDNGDTKGAQETRKGDKVTGQYTVNDPDGTIRVVTYTVDGDSGFVANVETKQGGAPIVPKALKDGEVVSGTWATDFKAPDNVYFWNEKVPLN